MGTKLLIFITRKYNFTIMLKAPRFVYKINIKMYYMIVFLSNVQIFNTF